MLTIGPHPNMWQDIGAWKNIPQLLQPVLEISIPQICTHNLKCHTLPTYEFKGNHPPSVRETCKIYRVIGQSTTLQIVQWRSKISKWCKSIAQGTYASTLTCQLWVTGVGWCGDSRSGSSQLPVALYSQKRLLAPHFADLFQFLLASEIGIFSLKHYDCLRVYCRAIQLQNPHMTMFILLTSDVHKLQLGNKFRIGRRNILLRLSACCSRII